MTQEIKDFKQPMVFVVNILLIYQLLVRQELYLTLIYSNILQNYMKIIFQVFLFF